PERAAAAGLTTVSLHHGNDLNEVIRALQSGQGRHFLDRCHAQGLEVEYELHAMHDLLPRNQFDSNKTLFRMNEKGERVGDANCCVHSTAALDTIARNAVSIARVLP